LLSDVSVAGDAAPSPEEPSAIGHSSDGPVGVSAASRSTNAFNRGSFPAGRERGAAAPLHPDESSCVLPSLDDL